MEVLKAAIDGGKIKNVGEAYTDGWLPANAQRNMEQFLTANNNKVDAVVAANDGTAGGADRGARGAGPRRLRAGFGPGRRQGGAEPRRARHADRVGLEGRARTRQATPPRSPSQLAGGKKLERDQGRARPWNRGPKKQAHDSRSS